ncbi:MAG: OB-fold putative lipoprotein [Bacteroidetes bacterium]|nr:OB-fold putative lipoprotein [Bacteroidota bacterium]MBU1720824.1 OB-fold putative lipoprotein [Bacteroidota bacterium]
MKYFLIILLVFVIGGTSVLYYIFNKPHRNVSAEKPSYCCDAKSLCCEFQKNETTATEKYLNKVIQVNGIVESIEKNQKGCLVVVLSGGKSAESSDLMAELESSGTVSCTFVEKHENNSVPEKGDQITVKGLCTGKAMDVVLIECTFVKNSE